MGFFLSCPWLLSSCTPDTVSDVKTDPSLSDCCRIYTEDSCFGGIIFSQDDQNYIIATAAHGIDDPLMQPLVEFYDKSTANSVIIKENEDMDIAFLAVSKADVDLRGVQSVFYDGIDDIAGISVYSYDLFSEPVKKIHGELFSSNEYLYDFDKCMMHGRLDGISEGMSGTAVFDDDGKCLGIIIAGNDDGEFAGVFYKDMMNLLYFP